MIDNVKGGRGQCKYCGEFHNNVSFHEELECIKAIKPLAKERIEKLIQSLPLTIEEVIIEQPSVNACKN
jgi:hypothetical protein